MTATKASWSAHNTHIHVGNCEAAPPSKLTPSILAVHASIQWRRLLLHLELIFLVPFNSTTPHLFLLPALLRLSSFCNLFLDRYSTGSGLILGVNSLRWLFLFQSLSLFLFAKLKMAALRPHTAAKLFPILLLSIIVANMSLSAAAHPVRPAGHSRKLGSLVEEPEVVLTYHNGPLLTSKPGSLRVHLIWYGKFTPAQRSIVADFLQSLSHHGAEAKQPSVSAWWNITHNYNNIKVKARLSTTSSSSNAMLGKQVVEEDYSLGKSLKRTDIASLVEAAVKSGALPQINANAAVYLVLTSEDVTVEGFCMSSCGFHANLNLLSHQQSTRSRMMGKQEKQHQQLLPYAWVGNSESQCPGQCAWPFHQPIYGPQTPPLRPPNGDMGIDGMIINIATVLAGAVTNPFDTGYFQGDATSPLEAVSACPGIYGKGAYSGFPGVLPLDDTTGASYNAHGLNGRKYLLPAMWDPTTSSCKTPLV